MYSEKGMLHNFFVVKKSYDALWDKVMERFDLTRAEIDVLAFIANNPDMNTAHEIVEYRMIAKSHVSKAVDNLLERGYLIREKDSRDRRCMHLIPTEAASDVVAEILSTQKKFASNLSDGISGGELMFFAKMARKVAENAEKML